MIFLDLSRKLGVDYGLCLAWADVEACGEHLDDSRFQVTPTMELAAKTLTGAQKDDIRQAVLAERARRERVLRDDAERKGSP